VTRVLMHTGSRLETKVRFLRLKARLVPTTAGSNWPRGWRTSVFETNPSGDTTQLLTVATDGVDPEKGWRLQVKVIFDRDLDRDWTSTLSTPFDTSSCALGSPGGVT
jgi:hypothetical protein